MALGVNFDEAYDRDSLDGKGGFGFSSDLKFGPGQRDLNRCIKFAKVVQGKATRVTDWRCDEQPF